MLERGAYIDPDEVETIDGVLLHNVGGEYHRVANGIPVAIVKGKVVDLITKPINPADAIRY